MSRHIVEVDYAVQATGPLHIGLGHGGAGLDRTILRDRFGFPFIPGSTIKGRARYAAMRICSWMRLAVLEDTTGEELGVARPSPNGPRGERDFPTRIFGCAWAPCTLRFGDARTEAVVDPAGSRPASRREMGRAFREVRAGAARSRLLGTVSHAHLYHTEVAPPGLVFHGSVRGSLVCTDSEAGGGHPLEVLLLWLALRLMVEDGVGANKSAGAGKLAWTSSTPISFKIDGSPFVPDDDAPTVLDLLPDFAKGLATG